MTDYLVVQRLGEIEFALSRLRDTIRECSQPQVFADGPQAELFALAERIFVENTGPGFSAVVAEDRAREAFDLARVFLAQRDAEKEAA